MRLFVPVGVLASDDLRLEGNAAHYLGRVMRVREGDHVTLLDGTGLVVRAQVEAVEREGVHLRVVGREQAPAMPVATTLYQGLPKGDKLEWVIQKATELGVSGIVPVVAARSVVQVKAEKAEAKLTRWRAIAQEAAEQCERADLPRLVAPLPLAECLTPGVDALVLSERSEGLTLPRALPATPPAGLAIFVGPEGGWAPEELALLSAAGAREVSLGPRILRTETAGLAALAMVMAAYELS